MTRTPSSTTARLLWSLAGPRGPMRSAAEDDRQRQALLAGDPVVAARRLLEALRSSTPPAPVRLEDVEIEAADLLSELLRAPGAEVLTLLDHALAEPATRTVALDAFALSAETRAGPRLAALVDRGEYADWSDRELIKLASALGCVQGDHARRAIANLNAHGGWPKNVQDEMDLATKAVAAESE